MRRLFDAVLIRSTLREAQHCMQVQNCGPQHPNFAGVRTCMLRRSVQVHSPTCGVASPCGANCEFVLHSPCHTTGRSVLRGPLDLVPCRVGQVSRRGARPLCCLAILINYWLHYVTTTKLPQSGDWLRQFCSAVLRSSTLRKAQHFHASAKLRRAAP